MLALFDHVDGDEGMAGLHQVVLGVWRGGGGVWKGGGGVWGVGRDSEEGLRMKLVKK